LTTEMLDYVVETMEGYFGIGFWLLTLEGIQTRWRGPAPYTEQAVQILWLGLNNTEPKYVVAQR
jgi:hypothetical protein